MSDEKEGPQAPFEKVTLLPKVLLPETECTTCGHDHLGPCTEKEWGGVRGLVTCGCLESTPSTTPRSRSVVILPPVRLPL